MVKKKLPQIKKIVASYLKVLAKQGVKVERAILFGSYARGLATPSSDIDLVVISRDLSQWPFIERLQMLSRSTLAVGEPLEVIGYTPAEIKKRGGKSIFWAEITSHGREIYRQAA